MRCFKPACQYYYLFQFHAFLLSLSANCDFFANYAISGSWRWTTQFIKVPDEVKDWNLTGFDCILQFDGQCCQITRKHTKLMFLRAIFAFPKPFCAKHATPFFSLFEVHNLQMFVKRLFFSHVLPDLDTALLQSWVQYCCASWRKKEGEGLMEERRGRRADSQRSYI